jgi:hypothetical protein
MSPDSRAPCEKNPTGRHRDELLERRYERVDDSLRHSADKVRCRACGATAWFPVG